MARKIWVGNEGKLTVASETPYHTFSDDNDEDKLQRMFNDYPEVIPVEDFRLSDLMVIGRETRLPSGYIDLIAVTRFGDIVIIEFKNTDNAGARREVVGQLLDYGASLWKKCGKGERRYDIFDETVAKPYFRCDYCTDTRLRNKPSLEVAACEFFGFAAVAEKTDAGSPDELELFKKAISDNLEKGEFIYIIVCPEIPEDAKNIMEYLYVCKKVRIYGVELDYFRCGGTEIVIPRSVPFGSQETDVSPSTSGIPKSEFENQLTAKGPGYWEAFVEFQREVQGLHGTFRPYKYGMGAYLPFGSAEGAVGAIAWIDVRTVPLQLFSGGQLDYYAQRKDLDWFTEETAKAYREQLKVEFPDLVGTLQAPQKYGANANVRDAAMFRKCLQFVLRFYKEQILSKAGVAQG